MLTAGPRERAVAAEKLPGVMDALIRAQKDSADILRDKGAGAIEDEALLGRLFEAETALGRTLAETLAAYFAAMGARNADPGLDIYTPETRRMLEGWVMTPAQMDNLVETYRRCHGEPARRGPEGRLAVIRYPPGERACAPWFFQRVDGAWALDLTMMQRVIRFNHGNYWRIDTSAQHPYRVAFDDWAFDRHGFPKQP